LLRLAPGDPALLLAGDDATPEQITALTKKYGLDRPLTVQYLSWLGNVMRGDLGHAFISRRPLGEMILARLPTTVHLAVATMIVMLGIGFPLGILAAVRPYSLLGRLVDLFNATAIAIPSFWLGILLLLFFGVRLGWFPTTGFVPITEDPVESIRHLVLPAFGMGTGGIAVLMRFLKSSLTEVAGADFIRTARAKGLAERAVVSVHMLKIAMLPVITMLAIYFGSLLGGAVITEAIFGLPGVGRMMISALQNQEYLVVQSTMLLFVGVFVILNILADVVVALLDPRIRL
jgi:peptide/nickel transport system permease protein